MNPKMIKEVTEDCDNGLAYLSVDQFRSNEYYMYVAESSTSRCMANFYSVTPEDEIILSDVQRELDILNDAIRAPFKNIEIEFMLSVMRKVDAIIQEQTVEMKDRLHLQRTTNGQLYITVLAKMHTPHKVVFSCV